MPTPRRGEARPGSAQGPAPRPSAEAAAALRAGAAALPPRRERVKILVVDDHRENLLAMESVLAGLGHALVCAGSGEEALGRLLDEDFAVILLDVQMPGMDGFETAALIRSRESSRSTPIIFMTAYSMAETHVYKGYSVGAVDYLFKPVVPEMLRAKVSVFVDLFLKTEQVKEQEERLRQIESRRHRRELAQARAQRNQFFYLSLDMMCVLGFDGYLKEFNAAWETALGYAAAELAACPFADLIHPEDRARTAEALSRLQGAPGRALSLENRVRGKDGAYRWLLWSATAFAKEDVCYATARDITERKEAEQSLKTLNDTLEQRVRERTRELAGINAALEGEVAERRRAEDQLTRQARELLRSNAELEEFAYVASHDLREPLRKVIGFAQLLKERARGALDAEGEDYLRIIVEGVGRMQELISDLLEYSQLGQAPPAPQRADCGAALAKALANLAVLIEETRAEVAADPLPALPAHPTQLVSLFQNLVGNAVKFHGDASPVVHVAARREGEQWHFSVRDNGIGIDPRHHERIFAIFKRLHSRAKYPGTGIGLAICKKIVERHHGRIWLESSVGEGSTFHFTLPASPEAP